MNLWIFSLFILNDRIMNKGIKVLVSRQKKRYQEGGYDLDLSYITDRIIAMGFPANNLEGVYRNHIDDVQRFLEEKHKDHYKIYNLCRERSYDESRFHNRVKRFYFADHNPPPLNEIRPLCEDIATWLKSDKSNVAVVHCKAGKGRTGVMICCYLIHARIKKTAKEALDFYDDQRTYDKKGVTIPSQRRYVEYYATLVSSGFKYNPMYVRLKEARMTCPIVNMNSVISLTIGSHGLDSYSSQVCELRKGRENIVLGVAEEQARPFRGDIRIELRRMNIVRRSEKICSAWVNTHFLYEEGKKVPNGVEPEALHNSSNNKKSQIRQSVCSSSSSNSGSIDASISSDQEIVTFITKSQLDKASKDSHHKLLPKDFKLELRWLVNFHSDQRSSLNENIKGICCRSSPSILTPSGTSSDEDEEDDEDEDDNTDWESEGAEVLL